MFQDRSIVFSKSLDKITMSLRGKRFSVRSNLKKVSFARFLGDCFAKERLA